MHHQPDVGDPSEQTRQAKGVVHAASVMDPQHAVKTHLGTNIIISRSACETDSPYDSLHPGHPREKQRKEIRDFLGSPKHSHPRYQALLGSQEHFCPWVS